MNKIKLSLAFVAMSAGLFGQSTSQITGTVKDTSGAVIPGADVKATDEATGVTYKQKTTGSGLYAFPSVPVGKYTILVDLKGFKTAKSTGNLLQVNTPLTVDVNLQIGESTETVSVEASYEKLQTSNATVGNVVDQKTVQELPLNGRNPLSLLTIQSGVVQRSANAAGSGVHVNGSRDRAYNVTIDGIEANESTVPNPTANLYRLTPDNITEYKVTTSNATPEEGRNSGANISIATRQGGNDFHGTAFEFFRNSKMNSNEFFANANGTKKPDIKMNQYGAEVGGPIKRNKTFFFFSWADQKINTTQPIDQTFGNPLIYTDAALAGTYRYWVADPKAPFALNGSTITTNTGLLVNRGTGELNPGVRTCASPTDAACVQSFNFAKADPRGIGIDPTIAKLFSIYPKPNNYASAGDGLNTATYSWNAPANVRGPNYMARVDHTINQSNSVFARVLWGDYNTLLGDPLNGRPQVFPTTPALGEVYRTTRNYAVGIRSTLSPRLVNEFTAGLSRFVFLFTQGEANPTWPNVVPYSFANVSLPFINTPRTFRAVTTPQFLDNLTYVRGAHVFKVGINVRMYQHNDQRGQPGGTNVTPSLSFSPTTRPPAGFNTPGVSTATVAGINPTDNTRLLGTINDVLGIPATLKQVFLGDVANNTFLPFISNGVVSLWDQGQRLKQYNFFLQDEWKVRNNLTVTYGLRWELNPAASESGGRAYVPNKPIDGSQGPVTFVHADRWWSNNNVGALGPRVGIAYVPGKGGKTVIRAGWGISFDTVSSFQVTAVAGKVPGLTFSCSSVPGGATTQGCQVVPDVRIAQNFPLVLTTPTATPQSQLTPAVQLVSNAPTMTAFDPNLKLPTVHSWDLSIQRELPKGFVLDVAYIGKRGIRLFRGYDLNQINAKPILTDFLAMQANRAKGCLADGTGCPTGATGTSLPLVTSGILTSAFVNSSTSTTDLAQNAIGNMANRIEQTTLALKLRPNQQFSTITYLDSGGDSYYHSLQVNLRKRFEKGLLFAASYTFAKSMDDMSIDPVGASSGGGLSSTTSRAPVDVSNWRNERGLSDFDRKHTLNLNAVYELPFGKGKALLASLPAFVNQIVAGWTINGIFTDYSGEPFSVRSGAFTNNASHQSRAALVGTTLPDTSLKSVAGVVGPVIFTDGSAFAYPAPLSSGMGRNMFRAPGYWNTDLGVGKKFDINERIKMQFRAEAFNALNHANFDSAQNASSGSAAFNSPLFGRTCCATVAPPSTQSIVQTGESGRVIQLGLKLNF